MGLRAVAETATHRFVFRRRLAPPYRDVRLVVSTEAGLRYLRPRLDGVDPSLLRLVTSFVQPRQTVWDVGANVGLFAFTAAHRAGPAGRVVAVEADSSNVALLRRSTTLATPRAAPVDVVPAAVSDVTGFARFNIAVRNRSTNYLDGTGSTQTGGIRETQIVPTVTLDHLLGHFPAPEVLKIDVEGAEHLALAGATAVLAAHPVIICEVTGKNSDAVRDLLSPYGYRFYNGELYNGELADSGMPVDQPPYCTLALPPGKRHAPSAS